MLLLTDSYCWISHSQYGSPLYKAKQQSVVRGSQISLDNNTEVQKFWFVSEWQHMLPVKKSSSHNLFIPFSLNCISMHFLAAHSCFFTLMRHLRYPCLAETSARPDWILATHLNPSWSHRFLCYSPPCCLGSHKRVKIQKYLL